MFQKGDKVEIKKPNLNVQDDLLVAEVVDVLKSCNFQGKVTQVQDNLNYVAFKHGDIWITQVFKDEEIKEVK